MERVLILLEKIAASPAGVSFKELRAVLADAPSTVLTRALEPLLKLDFVAKDPSSGLYLPGGRFSLMLRAATDSLSLEERVRPMLEQLASQTTHSAAYFHWDGEWAYLREKLEQAESYHYAPVGHRKHPMSHTFLRPIFAHLPDADLERCGISLPTAIRQQIRRDGFYVQEETVRTRVLRVTAPVFFRPEGPVAGALGITSLELDLSPSALAEITAAVKEAAQSATRRFGTSAHLS